MLELLTGALLLSMLHATIPNHWTQMPAVAQVGGGRAGAYPACLPGQWAGLRRCS